MEPWFIYVVITYFIWAVTNLVDKGFLDKHFKSPIIYSLFGGIFQLVALILIPFLGFSMPPLHLTIMGLVVGALFLASILPFFKALSCDDATTVIPLGSLTPVLVLILSFLFLGESLSTKQYMAFSLFLVGGFLLSIKKFNLRKIHFTPSLKWISLSMFMFAITLILTKFTFNNVPFFEGFILLRMGTFLFALTFFVNKNIRKLAKLQFSKLNLRSKTVFISSQTLAILGQFFFNLAIVVGSISLVNAAQGVQYIFLFILTIFLSLFYPRLFHEKINKKIIIRKAIAIFLIVLAVYFINI